MISFVSLFAAFFVALPAPASPPLTDPGCKGLRMVPRSWATWVELARRAKLAYGALAEFIGVFTSCRHCVSRMTRNTPASTAVTSQPRHRPVRQHASSSPARDGALGRYNTPEHLEIIVLVENASSSPAQVIYAGALLEFGMSESVYPWPKMTILP